MIFVRFPAELGVGDYVISNGAIWGAFSVIIAVTLAFYLLRSFALFFISKKAGLKYPFLAWIPLVWIYNAGKLCGDVNFFGSRFKAFVPILTSVFIATGLLSFLHDVLYYYPLIGYFLQGGEIGISLEGLVSNPSSYLGNTTLIVENIKYPYMYTTKAFGTVMNVTYWIINVLDIVNIVLTVFMYIGIFKKYLPGHYLVSTIFSVFGLFPAFLFAVRKNTPMNYSEYIRKRYANIYGQSHTNAQSNGENQNTSPFEEFADKKENNQDGPFEEFVDRKSVNPDDPFDEFNDKN